MDQNDINDDNFSNSRLIDNFKILLRGILGYISIVSVNVLLFIGIILILFDTKNLSKNYLTLYFYILSVILITFSISTTKIFKNHNISYQIRQFVKRFADIVICTLFFLFILSWLMPLVTILVRLEFNHPVFFKSRFLGQNRKPFFMYKFRTLKLDGHEDKISRIGKILRLTNLDELPLYFNVLVGEMSLVGPRPRKITDENNLLMKNTDILKFKPGITGLAQISNKTSYDDILKCDLEYINNWSLFLDFKIFFKTIYIGFRGYK